MKRKTLMTAALALVMAVTIPVGCGKESASEEQGNLQEETSEETAEETSEESAEESSEESAEPTSEESEEEVPEENVTLNIIGFFPYTYNYNYEKVYDDSARALIEEFENANPGIKIELMELLRPWQGWWEFILHISSNLTDGDPRYDIMWLGDGFIDLQAEETFMPIFSDESFYGVFSDLTPYIENDGIDISAYGDISENLCVDGLQYGLPVAGRDAVTMISDDYNSGNSDAAWEFIKFVCSEEGAKIYEEYRVTADEESEN